MKLKHYMHLIATQIVYIYSEAVQLCKTRLLNQLECNFSGDIDFATCTPALFTVAENKFTRFFPIHQ